jgi:hypothetical protein
MGQLLQADFPPGFTANRILKKTVRVRSCLAILWVDSFIQQKYTKGNPMNKKTFVTSFALLVVALIQINANAQVAKSPTAPSTGSNSVQMFAGGSQNVWLAVYPPTVYTDGSAIAKGKRVSLKFYQSVNGGKTYTSPVTIESMGTGTIGQGKAGSRQKPWIDAKLKVHVDNKKPHLIYLAVSAVVDGVEGPATNANLTFRYYPGLTRYASVAEANDANGVASSRKTHKASRGPLQGTYYDPESPGSKFNFHQKGSSVSGNFYINGLGNIRFTGTYRKNRYSLNAKTTYQGKTKNLPLTIVMSDSRNGTLSTNALGKSESIRFRIVGRKIVKV